MIGVIGYGMVGKAVVNAFTKAPRLICDPKYNDLTIENLIGQNPEVIFVCVPTPTDDTNYSILCGVLQQIKDANYTGITVVKSTVLPKYIEDFDVVYNPEFLSRATANEDFINPPMVILGGDIDKTHRVADIYRTYSIVNMDCVKFTDIKTASLAKYTMNSFYATKVTFMNQMYDVAQQMGVEWNNVTDILSLQPWMGTHHFQVPGPDGSRGFGGPCLPKDTEALVKEYNLSLLQQVLELNSEYRMGH
jgi:UDPglucose 6-dehydrogenase